VCAREEGGTFRPSNFGGERKVIDSAGTTEIHDHRTAHRRQLRATYRHDKIIPHHEF
jgi:hypothetical protein